mgnify:CR=1 FL=1
MSYGLLAPFSSASTARQSRRPAAWKSPRSKPIELLWRGIAARVRDVHTRPLFDLDETLSAYRADDDHELLTVITRAARTPATTTNADWMQVIVHTVMAQWNSQLAPVSAFAQLRTATLALSSPSKRAAQGER